MCVIFLPLRIVVLLWGYMKLVGFSVFIPYVWKGIAKGQFMGIEAILLGSLIFIAMIDIIFDLILIYGAHFKKPSLLITYNYYNIVLIFVTLVGMIIALVYWVPSKPPTFRTEHSLYVVTCIFGICFICAFVYFSVMVRSLTNRVKMQQELKNNSYDKFNGETESVG